MDIKEKSILINTEKDYLKYEYVYINKYKINKFIENIEDNLNNHLSRTHLSDSHYDNPEKILDFNDIEEIKNKFELNKFFNTFSQNKSDELNLKTIKNEILKYNKNDKEITEIKINYDFKNTGYDNDKYLTEILFGDDINTIFNKKVNLVNTKNLTINKVYFKGSITLVSTISNTIFKECNIEEEFILNKNNGSQNGGKVYNGNLIFSNTSFNKLKFNDFNIGELKIEFTSNYKNTSNLSNDIEFNRCNINKLTIYGENLESPSKIGSLIFSHSKFNKDSEVLINNLLINIFKFESFTNLTNSFKITNIKVIKEFNLKDVDFGKVIFNGLNLSKSILNFKHPTFNNCIFNNVIWSKDCEINNSNSYERRDIYRQMKYIMDSSGDIINGSKFYKNEMIVQKEIIENGDFFEKLIFWFGYHINDFGQNWFKPLLILLIINFLLWILEFIHTYNSPTISLDLFTICYLKNLFFNFSSYISYLLPFRKLVENPTIYDTLARTISVLLIYQSAVAMRRKIER